MAGLNTQEALLLAIIAATLALIVSNRVRADLVALLALLALGLSGVLPADEALAGFSRPAVITMVGLFVITDALEQTGVVQWLADRLAHLGGGSELRIVAVFMGAGALLSLVMNNIAAGAVLLPAAVQVARRARVPNSRLLMPLGFATLLGGMATLFTTANIVVSGALQAQGQPALSMLDFLPTGGAVVVAGTLYMLLAGRKLLPDRRSAGLAALASPDLADTYQLAERLWEVRVLPNSPLVSRPLSASGFGAALGVTVMAIWHGREAKIAPPPDTQIAPNDLLLVLGREERVRQLEAEGVMIGRETRPANDALELSVHLTEVIIGPRAPAIGQTIKGLRFRSKFGLTAVALWREGRSYRTDVGDFALQAGDALLMVGPADRVRSFASEPGYIVLDQQTDRPLAPSKGWLAFLITALVIGLSAAGLVPTAEAMLAGAAALVVTGCLSMEDAYRAVEWRVVMLVAGLLPIGTALVQTGVAARMGQAFTATLAPAGPLALVAGLYLFTALVTQLVGGQVTALIVGPIAVSAAVSLGLNPTAVGVVVAIACSAAFLTPISHPVNALMMAPGGYTAGDFWRVGAGLSVVCFATLMLALPLFWSL